MKLSEYARKNSITYRAAFNHWKNGLLRGRQLPTGTIVIDDIQEIEDLSNNVVLYARTSSSEDKDICEQQLTRLRDYSSAKGYKIIKEVKEIGSGLNDRRPKLEKILKEDGYSKIIVEHKDRLARFGINYIEVLLNRIGKKIEIINETDNAKEDLLQDLVSIITSFCSRIYGLRRSKRKTEKIIKELENENNKKQ